MAEAPAVVVEDIVMQYRVREDRTAGRRLGGLLPGGRPVSRIDALRGVSLEVPRGQRLGIVGRNGSGKSTLMSIIAGLRQPTSGRVLVSDYPVMLGVSAVLNRDLSGYQNVLLGCTALGMRREEARRRAPEILGYAGVSASAGRPMRTYSSGMRARLGFAIATVVEPEILLVDEALATGDAEFRRRGRERVKSIADRAGAVVLVSHTMRDVRDNCDRVVWLDDGRVVMDGPVDEVTAAYEAGDGRP
ncbi:Teichoic acid export ATP-binding protein TagH [Euzebya pacifica]|uniref:Teichoic acid export ATP-binding protein TagH n=1 Tax=Euzebya pacifica TaxID=1608957 RepID=A0A346XW30_9ACTN|nr:ATP-binding cassette domain-containing protein [Euzebya pacifica]AXV06427.1 Teichoic acid export ATP-binding protein TagH [Euzebya pacifica]